MKKFIYLSMFSAALLTGCASMSHKEKTIAAMAGAAIIVGTIDANIGENRHTLDAHSVAVGATAAAVTGIASLFYFNDEAKQIESERKLQVAEKEIEALRDQAGLSPKLVSETQSTLDGSLPSEYQKLIEPGKSQVYRLNQWINQGENVLIHQDKMVKMIPAQLKPNQSKE